MHKIRPGNLETGINLWEIICTQVNDCRGMPLRLRGSLHEISIGQSTLLGEASSMTEYGRDVYTDGQPLPAPSAQSTNVSPAH